MLEGFFRYAPTIASNSACGTVATHSAVKRHWALSILLVSCLVLLVNLLQLVAPCRVSWVQ